MENSSKGNLILFALMVTGFGLGWVGSAIVNDREVSTGYTARTGNVDIQSRVTSDDSQPHSSQITINETEDELAISEIEARLLKSIFDESFDHQSTVDRVIEYYKLSELEHLGSPRRNKQLRDLLRNIPELSFGLLDRYPDIDDQRVKMQLGLTLMINNSMQKPFLEPRLMEKIKQNDERSGMLKLLGEWGLQSKSNLHYLQSELPYLDDPNDLGSAIRAISSSSWVKRSALEPEVMRELSTSIDEYLGSDFPEVRASAVAAMRTIPPKDYRQKLLNGFEDSSELVRREAMLQYLNNPFKSSVIEKKLFKNLQDQELGYRERSILASSLERISLSDDQKRLVKEVQRELQAYAESLSKAELEKLRKSSTN